MDAQVPDTALVKSCACCCMRAECYYCFILGLSPSCSSDKQKLWDAGDAGGIGQDRPVPGLMPSIPLGNECCGSQAMWVLLHEKAVCLEPGSRLGNKFCSNLNLLPFPKPVRLG